MFHEMRRKKQSLAPEMCEEILQRGSAGTLALCAGDGYPYAVPMSYVYANGKIYFHSAASGHKLDVIAENPLASFCVIDCDEVVPEEYTTYYRSVIVFGEIGLIEDEQYKREAIELLAGKYFPSDTKMRRDAAIEREFSALQMLELIPKRITGKEAIELVRRRSKFN